MSALDDPERVKAEVTKALNDANRATSSNKLNELLNEYAIEIKIEDRPAEYWQQSSLTINNRNAPPGASSRMDYPA